MLISLIIAISSLVLGVFIYSKGPKISLNKVFALLCLSVSLYCFTEFGMRQAINFEEAYIWFNFAQIYPLIAALWFHFILLFSEKYNLKKKKILLTIYLIGIGLVLLNYKIYVINLKMEKYYWGWDFNYNMDVISSAFIYLTYIYMTSLFFFGSYLSIKIYISTSDKTKKKQAKYISIGCLIPITIFLITDFLLGTIFTLVIPSFALAGFSITFIFIGYAIWKYELFSLDLKTATEKIFSAISDCLILTDSKGIILSTNSTLLNLLKYQEKDLLKKSFEILLASEQDLKLFHYQSQLLMSNENGEFLTDIEVDFKTKTDDTVKISLTSSKIYDKYGDIKGILYIGRNITKTRKIEEELDNAIKKSQIKTKFISSMSHELRTPLNAIIGFVELLLEDYCGPLNKCQTNFLLDVKFSSSDLLELITRLLDLSKIEAGELVIDIKRFNLKTFLDSIQSTLKPLCIKKKLEFYIENDVTYEFIKTDYIRLKEILLNLLDNAIKFTPKGSITLKIKEQRDFLEFNITDTGIGIAESEFENIFEEFHKIKNPEVKNYQGMGLGLTITNQILTLLGGNISFSSELGKGSTFTFSIPITYEEGKR